MNDAEKALLFRTLRALVEGQLLLMAGRETWVLSGPNGTAAYALLIRNVLTAILEVEHHLANNHASTTGQPTTDANGRYT